MSACRHSLFPLYLMSFRGQKRHVKLTRKRRPMLARPLLFYGCPALRQDKKKRKIPGGWQAAFPLTHENRVFSKASVPEAVRRILARRKLTKWQKDFYFMLWISKLWTLSLLTGLLHFHILAFISFISPSLFSTKAQSRPLSTVIQCILTICFSSGETPKMPNYPKPTCCALLFRPKPESLNTWKAPLIQ